MAPGTTVVVGAAHGIGAAIARRVAGEAWTDRLVIAGISDAQRMLWPTNCAVMIYKWMWYPLTSPIKPPLRRSWRPFCCLLIRRILPFTIFTSMVARPSGFKPLTSN